MRHGETEWAISGQHTGRADVSLTANGELESQKLGERLKGIHFQHVFVSPLQRAIQTCNATGLVSKVEMEPDLIEWDNGDYEGKTHIEIESDRPGWNLFRDGCPNGESPQQVSDRADRLVSKLNKLEGNVALFSHGHLCRSLGARWIGLPILYADGLLLGTASICILSYQHQNVLRPAIELWNSTSGNLMPTTS
jgi:probable phosphoglycerate mutase